MILSLPWPPSVNHYWRAVRGRMLISREGREYRRAVVAAVGAQSHRFDDGRLAVLIHAHPPDRRRRDLDNVLKAPLDALHAAGVYADDSQIDVLTIERGTVHAGGLLRVQIDPIVQFAPPDADDVESARRQLQRTLDSDFRGC